MMILFLILASFVPLTGSAPELDYGPVPQSQDYASGIPVVTYHQISLYRSAYSATPARLRSDLQDLYDAGFFLILPTDLEDGLSRIPFDRRPIMITFDDGWEDNFRFIETVAGEQYIDPDCAVAIVNTFLEEHPDFGPGVVFFISWDKVPFGVQTEEKLNLVLDMGHFIGNHSADHLAFTRIPPSRYWEQIIPALNSFHRRLGLRTSQINVVAYPGGQIPRGVNAEDVLASMEYHGRPAVTQGYLVDGAVGSFKRFYEGNEFRISRIDMALYSVPQLLNWSNIMIESDARPSLHDDLPWRPIQSD
ncbi:MAG: polysaccharide deacetylase family protein [Candidatus Sabulitectum sp.]|nr:polysaccharide deacetylase family protein [Candidatus Sabulitectum sp.]